MDIIIHIPHDGNIFPEDLKKDILIPNEKLKYYHNAMSDLHLNHIAENWLDYPTISFPISRLFCDVERFIDNEPMEKYGMGFCYTNTFDGLVFKNKSQDVYNKTKKYYDEHHKKLDDMTENISRPTLLIDLHSFNPKATRKELLIKKEVPDICIGYDVNYCSYNIISLAVKIFSEAGYTLQENYPYSGSILPNAVIKNKCNAPLQSIMIEFNRDCYIDESGFSIPKECVKFGRILSQFCEKISSL